MDDLFDEMQRCKSVKECVELAVRDAYGEYEQATAWLTCMETIFEGITQVEILGESAVLEGFDLVSELSVVATCRRNHAIAKVALESVELLRPTPEQRLWIRAWKKWSHG